MGTAEVEAVRVGGCGETFGAPLEFGRPLTKFLPIAVSID